MMLYSREGSVYIAKLAEQAERYEGLILLTSLFTPWEIKKMLGKGSLQPKN